MAIKKTVTLSPEAIKIIEIYAKERGISFSAAINCIVYDGINYDDIKALLALLQKQG